MPPSNNDPILKNMLHLAIASHRESRSQENGCSGADVGRTQQLCPRLATGCLPLHDLANRASAVLSTLVSTLMKLLLFSQAIYNTIDGSTDQHADPILLLLHCAASEAGEAERALDSILPTQCVRDTIVVTPLAGERVDTVPRV